VKAITLWQPWASLVAAGVKPYEFRGWPAPRAIVGQRIGIHAGARPPRKDEMRELLVRLRNEPETSGLAVAASIPLLERWMLSPGMLPLSAMVCTAVLGLPRLATEIYSGTIDSDRIDHQTWGWPLRDIEVLEPVVPMRGAQGFWEWPGGDP
jgi:hypothetical protein